MTTLSIEAFKTNITLTGTAENDELDAQYAGGNNTLQGGAGDDILYANTNDKLYGEGGNDQLYSWSSGNNILSGGDGNDEIRPYRNDNIFGDAGDDLIFSGLGGNTITGGNGKDTFWLANAEYLDTPNIITDFNSTEDILLVNVDSFKEISQLTFTNQGNDTLVSAGDKQLAILQGAAAQSSVFSITSASAIEGNSISFTITRTQDSLAAQSVTVSTSRNQDDTASENDFTAKTETLTFAQGETTKTFTVLTTPDQKVEKDETFTVTLTNPTNAALINNSTAKGTINNDDIPLAKVTKNDIFIIKGEDNKIRLKVTLSELNSLFNNELCVVKVDDDEGRLNGISPNAANYNEEVVQRGKVVFSTISNLPNGVNTGDFTRSLEFDSGDNLKFFIVKNGTIDGVKAGKISLSNLIFADGSTQKVTDLGTQGFTLSWQDGSRNITDFKDLVIQIQSTTELLFTGTSLQAANQGELIDLRDVQGQIKANFSIHREAAFDNEVYFYKVDNVDGTIGNLQANSANRSNYLQAALNNILEDASGTNLKFAISNQGVQTGSTTITGGAIFAPMIIVNGTLSQLLDNNVNNDPQVYFPYLGVNSDGVDHIRLLGNNTFGFEDLPNGGDFDYNDIIIKMNFTIL